jgi:signal transduction histidine kinase
MIDPERFARVVSIACHDLRTPLATVYGFARTLAQRELDDQSTRYVEMIRAASVEMTQLLDELSIVARIASGRFDPGLTEVDSLELAQSAAGDLDEGRVVVSGDGAAVRVDPTSVRRALSQLARAASRHGGLDSVELRVDGAVFEISPLTHSSAPVVTGEELRELPAVAAVALIVALGGTVAAVDGRLRIELPAA